MKIKTPYFIIEFEVIFLIVFFSFIFSNEIKKLLFSFYICYLFIIFHELSHMLVASIFGKKIELFKFRLAGVNICFNNKNKLNKNKEILIYFAGPLSNIILALLFSYNKMIFEINLCFAIINLMPIYPLDGYNIVLNILRNTKVDKYKKYILKNISLIILNLLIILSILQICLYNNPSISIFLIYIFLLNLLNKDTKKVKILAKKRY